MVVNGLVTTRLKRYFVAFATLGSGHREHLTSPVQTSLPGGIPGSTSDCWCNLWTRKTIGLQHWKETLRRNQSTGWTCPENSLDDLLSSQLVRVRVIQYLRIICVSSFQEDYHNQNYNWFQEYHKRNAPAIKAPVRNLYSNRRLAISQNRWSLPWQFHRDDIFLLS